MFFLSRGSCKRWFKDVIHTNFKDQLFNPISNFQALMVYKLMRGMLKITSKKSSNVKVN
jgi:hypothetical protein